jgi:hypothetical protein
MNEIGFKPLIDRLRMALVQPCLLLFDLLRVSASIAGSLSLGLAFLAPCYGPL